MPAAQPGAVTKEERPEVQHFAVGWGDLDANNHLANTAILNRAADTRLMFFASRGFPASRFAAERLGPVIVRDELAYRRELRLLEPFTVDVRLVGLSPDGIRFALQNTFRNGDDEITAVVSSEGVWFDLEKRRPRVPPPDLDAIQRTMPRSRSFHEIPSRRPEGSTGLAE